MIHLIILKHNILTCTFICIIIIISSSSISMRNLWRIKQSPFNTNTNTNYVATCSSDVKIWNVSSSFDWTLITTYSQHSEYVHLMYCAGHQQENQRFYQ